MHDPGNLQCCRDPEAFWNGIQANLLIKFDVLTRIQNVEPTNPQCYGTAEDKHAPVQASCYGEPGRRGRKPEGPAEEEMRPRGETFGEGIEEKDRDGQWRQFESE